MTALEWMFVQIPYCGRYSIGANVINVTSAILFTNRNYSSAAHVAQRLELYASARIVLKIQHRFKICIILFWQWRCVEAIWFLCLVSAINVMQI